VRDDETIAGMRPKLVSFWVDHVLADVPPDPIDFDDIKRLFPMDNGQAIEATEEVCQKVEELKDIKARIKALEEKETRLTFEVAEFISPNSRLTSHGVDIATWKGQERCALDQAALKESHPDIAAKCMRSSVIRVLRLKK